MTLDLNQIVDEWKTNKNCSEQKYIMVAYGFKITLFRILTHVKI